MEENKELEELENEDVEETETEWTKQADKAVKEKSPKEIVIKTVKEIIAEYKELMKSSNDEMLLKGFEDKSKTEAECVNYVMNNLVKQRIFGGRDSLMYPYIHDYYVDELDKSLVADNWSSQIGGNGGGQQVRVQKPTKKDILEAYEGLTNEEKNQIYLEQLKKAEEEAKRKAQEKIKADEQKRKEKEAQEKKRKAEELAKAKSSGGGEQMSIFDF